MNRHGIDGIGAMGMGIKTRKKNNEIVIERNGNDKREETGA